MPRRAIIEAESIDVSYGKTVILENASCRIYPEEITCIVGGSGSGKTTLLKAFFGLIPITAGRIRLFEHELAELGEAAYNRALLRLGVLFQSGALLNSLTVYENLSIPLEQHTRLPDEIIRRMIEVKLRLVNLPEVEEMYPAELSGGMKKRAALARAIVLDPEAVFLDEPTAGLDPENSVSLDRLMISLREQLSMTLVVVTHELDSIRRIADRIVFVHEGRVMFEGSLEEAEMSELPALRAFLDPAEGC